MVTVPLVAAKRKQGTFVDLGKFSAGSITDRRARMYVPYGQSGLPYRLKNSIRNPRILSWFLHDLWRARR